MRPAVPRESFDSPFALDDAQAAAADVLATADSRGVYLWGPVGRGKTWLLDRYFAEVSGVSKKRVHFHSFFRDLHASYFRHGFSIDRAIDDVLADTELLVFDEFHVHDIGDAMLIARMLDALFARGVALVATSNYPPDGLLPNPLYHDRFAPTIDLLKRHLRVARVDGPVDFRSHSSSSSRFAAGTWTVDRTQEEGWSFEELCNRPRSAADYLTLIAGTDELVITDIPPLRSVGADAVHRFCTLVDVLYDADIRTKFHATLSREDFAAGSSGLDIGRMSSRLNEIGETPTTDGGRGRQQ